MDLPAAGSSGGVDGGGGVGRDACGEPGMDQLAGNCSRFIASGGIKSGHQERILSRKENRLARLLVEKCLVLTVKFEDTKKPRLL